MEKSLESEMMVLSENDVPGTSSASKRTVLYNLDFPATDWKHYFDYEVKDNKPVGICRKLFQV